MSLDVPAVAAAGALGAAVGALAGAALARRYQGPRRARTAAVAVATAACWALLAGRLGGWTLAVEAAMTAGLAPLAAVDIERHLLPSTILYPAAVATGSMEVAAAAATADWRRLATAAACAAGTWAALAVLYAARPGWIGFGDVRLAGLIGAGLGWRGPGVLLLGLVVANLAGAGIGVALVAAGRAGRRTPLPYGAFLAGGTLVALAVGR